MANTPYSSYLTTLLATIAAICALVAICNAIIDPYGLYRVVESDGFNSLKTRAAQRGRLFKSRLLEVLRPSAIVLGNSRAEVGFDPRHVFFTRMGHAANLALPGTGPDTALALLKRAIELKPPKVVVLGLDFVDARITGGAEAGGPSASERQWHSRAEEQMHALASLDAFADSLRTVYPNRNGGAPGLDRYGFNPMQDYPRIARTEGYYMLFLQRDLENAKSYVQGPKEVLIAGAPTSEYFKAIKEIAELCGRAGIELHLAIYPYHAHILELFHLSGLWTPFEDWKRGLVAVLQDGKAPTTAKIALWDFSGYTAYAMERVPQQGDHRSETSWYWEAGHFKKELGDVVLSRIAEQDPGSGDFGVDLLRVDIEQHLSALRRGRNGYWNKNPDEAMHLRELVRRVQGAGALNTKLHNSIEVRQ